MLCSGGLQGALEVIRDSHFDNFSFERERPYRRCRRCELRRVEAQDAKDCYTRETGNDLFEQRTCFPLNSGISRNIPGRARLLTYPFATGSLSKSNPTIGMLVVAFLTAATASGDAAKMTFILSRTRSPANSGIDSGLTMTLAKRYSIVRFLPSEAGRLRVRAMPVEGNSGETLAERKLFSAAPR